MKVVLAGGGTGGHIYPAISIAEKILEKEPDSEILFVGTEDGLESKLIPEHGFPIHFITVHGLNRKKLWKNAKVIKEYMKAKKETKKLLKEFKPDKVIGTGGYVSAPVISSAQSLGIDTYIQEQNAIPGVSNRLLAEKTKKVFLGFEEASKHMKNKENHVLTGNPVRDDFLTLTKEEARKYLDIEMEKMIILIFGGSGGAGRINKAALTLLKKYNGEKDVEVFFATGKRYYFPILEEIKSRELNLKENIHVLEYIDSMQNYLRGADVVVSRCGAIALAEITHCGKPAILIPSPNVTGDHQRFNGKAIADKGGAILLEEETLDGASLLAKVQQLLLNKEHRLKMGEKALHCAPIDGAGKIYEYLKEQ